MKETSSVTDKIMLDSLAYLRGIDTRWQNHNPQLYISVSQLPKLRKCPKTRETLVRLAFEAVSDEDWKKDGVVPSIAAAVELLATSTYVIDDILDNQPERYGEKATWRQFGLNLGILAGYLQDNIARDILRKGTEPLEDRVKVRILDLYASIIREVNEGQALNEYMKEGTTLEQYLERTYKACGVHFENSAVMGALVGGATEEEVELFKEIGKNFGMAFFIRNDLFNYLPQEVIEEQGSKALRRTSYEDLRKGLWTCPIIWLMEHGTLKQQEKIRNMLGRKEIQKEELIDTTRILVESGAVYATIELINRYRKNARREIKKLRESRAKRLLFVYDNMFDNATEYVQKFREMFK